jgi:CRISPR type I-E-associated protein CasB/Cse2
MSDDHIRTKLIEWHNTLNQDRKSRAELRRCANADDVILTPAFAKLMNIVYGNYQSGQSENYKWRFKIDTLAKTALILSGFDSVPQEGEILAEGKMAATKLASKMAATNGSRPAVSEMRANVFFRSANNTEACRVLRTLTPQIEPCDPLDIFNAMKDWDRFRKQASMDYHILANRQSNEKSAV